MAGGVKAMLHSQLGRAWRKVREGGRVCVCVCVCVARERERARERGWSEIDLNSALAVLMTILLTFTDFYCVGGGSGSMRLAG